MLKIPIKSDMFRSPNDHPQGVRQALRKLPLCTINMYAYVGDVGACIGYYVMPVSSCRCVSLPVMSGTVLRLGSGGLVSHMRHWQTVA